MSGLMFQPGQHLSMRRRVSAGEDRRADVVADLGSMLVVRAHGARGGEDRRSSGDAGADFGALLAVPAHGSPMALRAALDGVPLGASSARGRAMAVLLAGSGMWGDEASQEELVPVPPTFAPPAALLRLSCREPAAPPYLGRRGFAPSAMGRGPQVSIIRDKISNSRSGSCSSDVFDEIVSASSAAFESESPQRCSDAVSLFCMALMKAALGAIRSPSVASAVAMLLALLRSPREQCRRAALDAAARELDGVQLLRAVLRGMGGADPCRHWQAASNSLVALHLILSCCGKAPTERLRNAGGVPLVLEVWRLGGHNADVAQECCAVTLLLSHSASKQAALAGAAECALASWQRFGHDASRGTLMQGVAETTLMCLPHLNERPPSLPRLTVESLRALQAVGPAPAVIWLLKALARLAVEPKLAPELNAHGVADLMLGILSDERWGQEVVLRRLAAEAFARPLAIVSGSSASKSAPAVAFAGKGADLPQALPSAEEALEAEASAKEPGVAPTIAAAACASALHRRLVAWRSRLSVGAGAVAATFGDSGAPPPLRFDADFESGSLGPVTRIGPREYEISLVSDTAGGGDYVQWFCFRARDMQQDELYTFHLGNLIKPGSLFEEGCQPVMFSRKRRDALGTGWTREGSDVAYYPYHDLGRRHCISFDIRFPQDDDEVFLSHAPPYTYTDHLSLLARWCPDERRRSLPPTRGGRELTAVKLGDPAAPQQAWLVARAHPGETHASWVMHGALEFLCGGGEEAERCLQGLRWVLVPMLNPDGVASGRTRTNLDGIDLNRHHHDDCAPETRGLRALMQEEVKTGEPLAFVDIHSHSRRRGVFAIANGADGDPLVASMAAHSPLLDASGTSRAEVKAKDEGVGRVAASRLGFQYSVTLEASLCARHAAAGNHHLSLEDLLEVGRAVVLGIADLVRKPGIAEDDEVVVVADAPSATPRMKAS